MHTLSVYTEPSPSDHGCFDVHWRVGPSRYGVFRCTVVDVLPGDQDVAAELSVLQHLLEFDNVFGSDRAGNGLTLCVSSGAIRKLAMFKSDKRHLIRYSGFLTTRFSDATIIVDRPRRGTAKCWLSPVADDALTHLTIERPFPENIQLFGVGPVELRLHAMERYMERGVVESRTDAWRKLRNMARDTSIRQIRLPADLVASKLEKWGAGARDFYHRGTGWHFVVSDDDGAPRLVSMFHRELARPEIIDVDRSSNTLLGKTVLIGPIDALSTGALVAIVRRLHDQGANVCVDARAGLLVGADVAATLNRRRPDGYLVLKESYAPERSPQEFVTAARSRYGSIDALLACDLGVDDLSRLVIPATGSCSLSEHMRQFSVRLARAAQTELSLRSGVVVNLVVDVPVGEGDDSLTLNLDGIFDAIAGVDLCARLVSVRGYISPCVA